MRRVYPTRLVFLVLALGVYIAVAGTLGWLCTPPMRDEIHYWPTSLRFAEEPWPSIELLRGYGELNTPLPFIIFGWVKAVTGAGIECGRVVNAVFSFAVLCLFVLAARGPTHRVLFACASAWTFPYLLGVSFTLYTDMIAAGFAFAGFVALRRERAVLAAVAFVLAVSSRQYMIAVPAACGLDILVRTISVRGIARGVSTLAGDARAWACATAAAALAGWFLFFGDFGPPAEVSRQSIATTGLLTLLPRNATYFLAVVGAFFVPLWWAGLCRDRRCFVHLAWSHAVMATGLFVLVLVDPPFGNRDYPIETMGFLDKALRVLLGEQDFLRVGVLAVLAMLTLRRFDRWSLGTSLVLVHAVLLTKAHIAWDKYALACLICLWFIEADESADGQVSTQALSAQTAVSSKIRR